MKKALIVVCATIAILLASATSSSASIWNKSIKGSGNIETKTLVMPSGIREISASRAVNVIITDAQSDNITIKADDNIIEYVRIKTEGDEMSIGVDNKINSISNVSITVTLPNTGKYSTLKASSAASISAEPILSASEMELDASSAGSITAVVEANKCEVYATSAAKVKVAMKVSSCDIEASSAAKITAEVKADRCEIEASSAAKITVKGSTAHLNTDTSSSGKIDASQLVARDVVAEASSGSKTSLNCTDSLMASASSGADIEYTGDCKVNRNTSSGGSVNRQ